MTAGGTGGGGAFGLRHDGKEGMLVGCKVRDGMEIAPIGREGCVGSRCDSDGRVGVLFFTYDLPPSPPFLSFQSASEFVALGSNSREVVWLYIAVTPLL